MTVFASNDAAHAATVGRRLRSSLDETLDRVAGFDPGLSQLRMAVQAVLGILLAVGGNYLFVRLTGAMQLDTHGAVLPPEQAALVHAQHHAVLIIAMLLGAMMAMVSAFVVSDPTPRGQLITTALLPIPIFGAMTIGLLLGTHRMASLVFLVLALMTGTYLRRFGPRGFAAGTLVFNGGFMGFFLHAEIPPREVGWVAAELLIGVFASTLVRFTLFRPDNGKTLVRMQHSWVARSRRLLELSWQLSARSLSSRRRDQLSRRLHRQLIRINESTLMIDGQLAQPGASTAAGLLHQRLYDLELAVSNIARFTEALSAHTTDEATLTRLRAVLAALREDNLSMAAELAAEFARSDKRRRAGQPTDSEHTTHVLVRRFAGSVQLFATAQAEWLSLGEQTEAEHDDDAFTPAVGLFAGWLPGSVLVSARASTTPGKGRWFDRAALAPELRASIQIGVASIIAITVGDALNGQRFYWGLLATFLAFMATTNTGEQIRKALFRMGGTAIGIVIGDVAVRLTGTNTAVVLILVLVALFLGIYLIRINYMFMVIGITVTMSQLYVQLGEFSWHLLTLRLAETAIGVGAVVITVLFVVPLRSQRVIRMGVLDYFERLEAVVAAAVEALDGTGSAVSNRSEVRQLDAAHHALLTTAAPLRIGTFGANSVQLTRMLAISTAARYYARNLATGVSHWSGQPRPESLNRATDELLGSMAALHQRIEHGEVSAYVRSAALFEVVSEDLEEQPASFDAQLLLRDFTLLDAAMARLAQALDMPVRDHDTDHSQATVKQSVRH